MKFLTRRALLQAGASGLALAAVPAMAGDYPERAIRLVVPFPSGGLIDVVARMLGDRISQRLGQPLTVENRPGAGTLLGAETVARSAPDGYTLMLASTTTLGISPHLYKSSRFKVSDLRGVAMLGDTTLLLVTRPDFQGDTPAALVAAVRAKPGTYQFASPGSGTTHHLLMEMLKVQEGLDMLHVPYQGSTRAMTDLMSGRIDFMLLDLSVGLQQVKAGKLKMLAVTSAQRLAALPQVPTLAEAYPKLNLQSWQAVMAPAATPDAIVNRLNRVIAAELASPEFRERLLNVGVIPRMISAPELDQLIVADAPRWGELVKVSGAKVD